MASNIRIFAGTSHPELAKAICKKLGTKLSELETSRFACGEIYAKPASTVRGDDVFIIQTATSNVNEELMELFIIIDAMKRSFAKNVHVVIPHFPYARQDRVASPREPISAKVVANLIGAAGADHVMVVQIHSEQQQGFFPFPIDHLNARKLFAKYFKKKKIKDLVVVAPDAGAAKDADRLARHLDTTIAVMSKVRPEHNKAEITSLVGDVEGKNCIIFDDMIDTAGSICAAHDYLKKHGAKDVYVAATHAIFSGPAVERLNKTGFKGVLVTDTIPVKDKVKGLEVISVAPMLAAVIKNVHEGKSVTSVYRG